MAPKAAFDPVPDWLRETRLRQRRADGKPWTQDDLLARMQQEIGWAPHRPNYSKYESGKSKPETVLPRFVEFWAKLGEPGPDYTPIEEAPAPEGEGLAAAISALVVELQAMRQERESIALRLETLEAAVALLARPSGEGLSALGPPPVEAGSGR